MRRVTVDAALWQSREELHRDLMEKLSFPDYYGNNLDALHDMLTECRDTELTVLNAFSMYQVFGEWASRFFNVLLDSAEENHSFSLKLKS